MHSIRNQQRDTRRVILSGLSRATAQAILLAGVLAAFVCTAKSACAEESSAEIARQWNRFRGPSGSGVVQADLPTEWDDEKNLAWKTELPGRGSSSPVIWNGRVYLTAYTGYGFDLESPGDREALQLHVLCYGLDTGQPIWDCVIKPSAEEQEYGKRLGEHGYASPTPCVDDSGVYAFFGPSGLVAVSLDGEMRWQRTLGTKTAGFGAAASPILYDELVIQNASIESGTLYALEKSSGEVRWQADQIERAWTTPTIVSLGERDELVVNQKDAILGFDPSSGERLWRCDAIEDYVVPCVVVNDGMLYCSGGRSSKTFVIRPGGRGDVSESHLVWEQSRGANVTTPVVVNGHVFWSHDKSIALCLDVATGQEVFRERLPTRSRVYASIVSDGKHLFLTTRDSGVLVIDAAGEYRELAINRLGDEGEQFNATPAIAADRLLLRSDRTLYCVKKETPIL
ncbi:PQQ-binding-like beta-propeller repeat protein [Rhodopirellula sp. MGV]|uniref:outer membrane protein assembly factor BamB family protein n=1 Tax=Rhodopirellula sp. MGV TaxID=2023130 RepID=UPI0013047714|nr:PQQ-binding-like beta-propeller repeat protein [Rhodopirellula sp. MGV]